MKWSWKIGRLWGIDIFMHVTFLLIVGWLAVNYWFELHNWSAVFNGVLFILILFLCVVMHEYGHALTARRYGIKTRDITLYPIGGVARLERIPEKPIEELWVALAGPAVNLVIAFVLFVILFLTHSPITLHDLNIASGSFLTRLLTINLVLVGFNLLPAFPMDGGRVLRAILAMNMDHTKATQIAANVGQAMAFLFGFVGLFTDPFLIFIALFVWIGAEQEASMAQIKNSLGGIPVSRAMLTHYESLSSRDTLARVVELILAGSQQDFPVVEADRVIGILDRETFIKALTKKGENTLVTEVMRRDVPEVDTHEMVDSALSRLNESGAKTLPVTHAGQLVGLITSENITEFLMIRAALRKAPNRIVWINHP
jgi:Zn-dependent protease/predicted transcriptional regulator